MIGGTSKQKNRVSQEHNKEKDPDFNYVIQEIEVPLSTFRRKPRMVYEYIDIPGHIVVFTIHRKRKYVIMSIETYTIMSAGYKETLDEIEAKCQAHREKENSNEQRKG